ncbi:MAG: hypothetical protein LUH36_07260 [Oscillospiraceae bacterium]|nr:hypothetical protein [Oscillospiraceae bacterium]
MCTRHSAIAELRTLPEGDYLCAACTGEERAAAEARLRRIAASEYGAAPSFTVEQIVITAILRWSYQVQIFLG